LTFAGYLMPGAAREMVKAIQKWDRDQIKKDRVRVWGLRR
jgi:hypothetical protein